MKEAERIARKKGQKKGSKKHSDLYTDEDPKGTIKGLGFKDAATAKKGVAKINSVKRSHAHKVQATLVMQQRAKVAKQRAKDPEKKKDLGAAYQIWTKKLEQLKKKTKSMKEVDYHSKNSRMHKPDWYKLHGDDVDEDIKVPVKVGDTVLGGKFKNKKVVVKTIGKNEKGDITINGKPLLRYRIVGEASSGGTFDGEPDSGYLPKGKKRTLGTSKGKPEKWFDQGGYEQLDFPEADDIYGKGIEPDLKVKKTTTPSADTLKLKEIIEEGKKLTVFDFDDTLAKTDSWVYVNKNGKRIAQLDPGEFAVHKLKSGEEYDFSDFDKMLRNPKLIKNNAIEFRKQSDHARRTPGHQVTILTARGIGYPVKHWFKKMGLDVYVVALKSADPKKKADYIEKKIQSGYTDIYFIDDSPKNVRAVKALQVKYPKVKIKTVKA